MPGIRCPPPSSAEKALMLEPMLAQGGVRPTRPTAGRLPPFERRASDSGLSLGPSDLHRSCGSSLSKPSLGLAGVALALQARARSRSGRVARASAPGVLYPLFPVPNTEVELEVLGGCSTGAEVKPMTLLLVHGSYHAAWCYQENFLGFFRAQGFHTYAASLRGQGRGRAPELPVAGTLEEHASDVAALARHLAAEHQQPVVLMGHSFGGLMTLQAAEHLDAKILGGMILLCSVPPGGNVGIILRSLFRAPLQALRIAWGFIARAFERDAALCQEASQRGDRNA